MHAWRRMERGISVERVCSKLGLSQQAFYSWKKKFGDLGVADLGVADLRKLRCWKSSTAMRLSEWTIRLLGVEACSLDLLYESSRDARAALRMRLKDLAVTGVHCGYRRLHSLIQWEGWSVNANEFFVCTARTTWGCEPMHQNAALVAGSEQVNQKRLALAIVDQMTMWFFSLKLVRKKIADRWYRFHFNRWRWFLGALIFRCVDF